VLADVKVGCVDPGWCTLTDPRGPQSTQQHGRSGQAGLDEGADAVQRNSTSGPINGDSSTTPMSAIFIGAVSVSAQSVHRSGTGTPSMRVDAAWTAVAVSGSRSAFTLRGPDPKCVHK
jgi:hypothetical protein